MNDKKLKDLRTRLEKYLGAQKDYWAAREALAATAVEWSEHDAGYRRLFTGYGERSRESVANQNLSEILDQTKDKQKKHIVFWNAFLDEHPVPESDHLPTEVERILDVEFARVRAAVLAVIAAR